jgi:hypothetical protein
MSLEEKDQLSLAILESNEDVVLVSKPFCEKCATTKLKALFFCKISNKDAKELDKLYKIKTTNELFDEFFPGQRDKNSKNTKSFIQEIRKVRIKCECNVNK